MSGTKKCLIYKCQKAYDYFCMYKFLDMLGSNVDKCSIYVFNFSIVDYLCIFILCIMS